MSEKYFWAKTLPDGQLGISVFEHMLNVGCVAQCLAALSPALLERFQVRAELVGALAALHDLGKISPGFQRKCEAWLVENSLVDLDRRCIWQTTLEGNHAGITHEALELLLPNGLSVDGKSSRCLAALLGAHHGKIQAAPSRPYSKSGQRLPSLETRSGINWVSERQKAGDAVIDHFGVRAAGLEIDSESPLLWWLAGLTTVADWIGSDERNFPPEGGMADDVRMSQARQTIDSIGFGRPDVVPGLESLGSYSSKLASKLN